MRGKKKKKIPQIVWCEMDTFLLLCSSIMLKFKNFFVNQSSAVRGSIACLFHQRGRPAAVVSRNSLAARFDRRQVDRRRTLSSGEDDLRVRRKGNFRRVFGSGDEDFRDEVDFGNDGFESLNALCDVRQHDLEELHFTNAPNEAHRQRVRLQAVVLVRRFFARLGGVLEFFDEVEEQSLGGRDADAAADVHNVRRVSVLDLKNADGAGEDGDQSRFVDQERRIRAGREVEMLGEVAGGADEEGDVRAVAGAVQKREGVRQHRHRRQVEEGVLAGVRIGPPFLVGPGDAHHHLDAARDLVDLEVADAGVVVRGAGVSEDDIGNPEDEAGAMQTAVAG